MSSGGRTFLDTLGFLGAFFVPCVSWCLCCLISFPKSISQAVLRQRLWEGTFSEMESLIQDEIGLFFFVSCFLASFSCDICWEGNPLIWIQAPAGANLDDTRSCLAFVSTLVRCHVKYFQCWPMFPALEAVLESAVMLEELSDDFVLFLWKVQWKC